MCCTAWSIPWPPSTSVRYGRHAAYLQAFLHLACALICARFLKPL